MDNHTGSITDTASARASLAGRLVDLPGSFRSQAILTTFVVALLGAAGWLLFFAGASDQETIESRLEALGLDATFVEEDPNSDGLVYSVPSAVCDGPVLMVLTVGEAELDAPRSVLVDTERLDGPVVLDQATVPAVLNC